LPASLAFQKLDVSFALLSAFNWMSVSRFGSLPNLITLVRFLLVPVAVAMIASQRWFEAFLIFVIAGISDAVDGWLAKTFHLTTKLGAFLDPAADKALLISIYVALAIVQVIPAPLAIIVVARDLMIIGAIVMSWLVDKPVEIRPLLISKVNTPAQIGFAALVLAARAFDFGFHGAFEILLYVVAALTLASLAAYLWQWMRHIGL
jgi:cardiolipin synthase